MKPASTQSFLAFAAQGQSLFVATGDNGSASAASYVWPSDDPLVVAVGGTDITTKTAGGAWKSETGWSGSAGMPSKNKVPIPSYQQLSGVVTSTNHASENCVTSRMSQRRPIPANLSCYDGACYGGNGGTSYAAPLWAGFLALVNQQAVAQGKKAGWNLSIRQFTRSVQERVIPATFTTPGAVAMESISPSGGYDLVTVLGKPNWRGFDGCTGKLGIDIKILGGAALHRYGIGG